MRLSSATDIPFDALGITLRFCDRFMMCTLVHLCESDPHILDAAVACHALWGSSKDIASKKEDYSLEDHEWQLTGGSFPELLRRSVSFDPSRVVALHSQVTPSELAAAVRECPLPIESILWTPLVGRLSARHIDPLGELNTLQELSLSFSTLSLDIVESIASILTLQILKLNIVVDMGEDFVCRPLVSLTKLKQLELIGPGLDAEHLNDIAQIPSLTHLDLSGCVVGSGGVALLAAATQLTTLILSNCGLMDAGMMSLGSIPSLTELDISRNEINDLGVAHLVALTELRVLDLTRTGITDAGIPQLAMLPALDTLTLRETNITDVGVANIPLLRKLRDLTLARVRVTDEGIMHLARAPSLRKVTLRSTKTTPAGVDRLATAAPGLTIAFRFGKHM